MTIILAPRTTRAAEGMDRRRFAVAEIEAMVEAGIMAEDERVELVGGELVPMSPKGNRHELVRVALNRHWCRIAPDDIGIAPETTFRLSADTYLEPDFVLYPHREGLPALAAENVLLVVEISDSSKRYDTGRKADLYAGFGIRELWVVDAVRLTCRIFRDPGPEGYRETVDVPPRDDAAPRFAPDVFALTFGTLRLV